jgi:hypothetical protein
MVRPPATVTCGRSHRRGVVTSWRRKHNPGGVCFGSNAPYSHYHLSKTDRTLGPVRRVTPFSEDPSVHSNTAGRGVPRRRPRLLHWTMTTTTTIPKNTGPFRVDEIVDSCTAPQTANEMSGRLIIGISVPDTAHRIIPWGNSKPWRVKPTKFYSWWPPGGSHSIWTSRALGHYPTRRNPYPYNPVLLLLLPPILPHRRATSTFA